MATVAVLMVAGFAVYLFRGYWWWLIRAKHSGIEEEAVVSRFEDVVNKAKGENFPVRYTYVTFRTREGRMNEARLLNPKGFLEVGSRLRIRYLPEKDCFAVMAEAAVS